VLDVLEIEPRDGVAGLLSLEGEPQSNRDHADRGPRRLGDRDRTAGNPRHLREPRIGVLEVVQAVVDVDEVERAILERQLLGVGDHGNDVQAVAASALPHPTGGAERDVCRDDARARAGEQLRVHSGAAADRQRAAAAQKVTDPADATSELLLDQPLVQLRRAVRPRGLELGVFLVEVSGLAPGVFATSANEDRNTVLEAEVGVSKQRLQVDHEPARSSRSLAPMRYS